MVDMGASTFWEMWSGREGRLTRSHCHAWSAAPTYFLTTYVLGVRPGGPAFSPVVIEPHPGDLTWCRGVMPTPEGDVEVQWENPADGPFVLRVSAPEGADLDIRLPREGTLTVNGREA
jgi:alpha-L-rhamnosidase